MTGCFRVEVTEVRFFLTRLSPTIINNRQLWKSAPNFRFSESIHQAAPIRRLYRRKMWAWKTKWWSGSDRRSSGLAMSAVAPAVSRQAAGNGDGWAGSSEPPFFMVVALPLESYWAALWGEVALWCEAVTRLWCDIRSFDPPFFPVVVSHVFFGLTRVSTLF